MADTVGIGTIKMFDAKSKRGVIVPRAVAKAQTKIGGEPVYFEVPSGVGFRVGQLVQFVLDTSAEPVAKDVTVLSDSA